MPLRDLTNNATAGQPNGNTIAKQQQQQQMSSSTLSSDNVNTRRNDNNNDDGPQITIVSVEASIGVGKSSLLRMLHKRVHDMKHLTPETMMHHNQHHNQQQQDSNDNNIDFHGAEGWKWVFVQEPVEMWQDVRKFHSDPNYEGEEHLAGTAARHDDSEPPSSTAAGEETIDNTLPSTEEFNLLGKFYKDPPAFAFKLQSWAMLSRIETVCRTIEEIKDEYRGNSSNSEEYPEGDKRPVLVVLERSWTSDRNTFSMMHRDSGCMKPYEWVMYDQMFNFASRNAPIIDGHIYLQCSAETCMKRLKKRDRHEESGVSADYQRALIQRHEDWLATVDASKLCRVNVNDEFISNTERADMIFAELCAFANGLFVKNASPVAASASASASSVTTTPNDEEEHQQQQQSHHHVNTMVSASV